MLQSLKFSEVNFHVHGTIVQFFQKLFWSLFVLKNSHKILNFTEKTIGRRFSKRFTCRFRMKQKQQHQLRKEEFTYRMVKMTGFIVRLDELEVEFFEQSWQQEIKGYGGNGISVTSSVPQIFNLPQNRGACELLRGQSNSEYQNLIFKGFVQISPPSATNDLILADANKDEYMTRLHLDGTLIYADHRITTVTGYFPSEVIGRSAYDFIMTEDHNISLFAHKLSNKPFFI